MRAVASVGCGASLGNHGSARRQTGQNTTVPPSHVTVSVRFRKSNRNADVAETVSWELLRVSNSAIVLGTLRCQLREVLDSGEAGMGGSSRPLPMPIDGEKPTVSEANGPQRTSDKLKPSEASLQGAHSAALDLTESQYFFRPFATAPSACLG